MRKKQVAIVMVSVLVVVLVVVCIMAAGPALMDAIQSIHRIPRH